jgi:hypothetical protein
VDRVSKCKHCNRTSWDHRVGDYSCPNGVKTRAGYIGYLESKFEPKEDNSSKLANYNENLL